MGRFRASTQYGDWTGSVRGDDADQRGIADYLEKKGVIDRKKEFLLAVEFYVGENHGGKVEKPYIHAFTLPVGGFDSVQTYLAKHPDPLNVRKIEIELSITEFLGLFKRFSIVITRRGVDLEGREYRDPD